MRILTLFAVLVLAVPVYGADVGDPVPLYRTELDVLRDASVRVWCGDAGGSGTVVFAEPGRSIVVTAAHVIEGGGKLTVRADGKTFPARVILTDRNSDFAALEVARQLPCVVAVGDEVRAGDEVLMIGGSSGHSRGKVAAFDRHNDRDVILADYDSISGDSGGGVFVRGQLVAVHVGRYGERARAPFKLAAFVAKAIRGERASAPAPSSVGDPVPMKLPPASVKTASGSECPGGVCSLPKAAPPVSGCRAEWGPPVATYPGRVGLFGLRRW